ncbi:MAG: twin-arginine translocase subunit TatC [Candidatus Omnitrophica bacterium]|nr:twin-arginine translocase subunit TatC [Candidatus Omnitrophota bacterium]
MEIDNKVTLVQHLDELRGCILKSVVCFILCSIVVSTSAQSIIAFFAIPVGKLIFITPQEAFVANVKIALFIGFFISTPFILYQIWKFISLGLLPKEKRYVYIFCPISLIFFILGVLFGYFVIVPISMNFLLGFSTDIIIPMITVDKYLSFLFTLSFSFALVFQLPIVLIYLTKIGIITPNQLRKRRREAIVVIFVVAAIVTPPDMVTQILMAIPLIFLYEIGIIFSKLAYKKKKLIKRF